MLQFREFRAIHAQHHTPHMKTTAEKMPLLVHVRHWLFVMVSAVLVSLLAFRPVNADDDFAKAFSPKAANGTAIYSHDGFAALLDRYVVASADGINRVRYRALKQEGHQQLKNYIEGLTAADPRQLTVAEQFAYWVNLYNAKTLDVVLAHYPVASIRDISLSGGLFSFIEKGPWKAKVVRVNGIALSLDDIEHKILRPLFADNRVHFAVNCASLGCPNLRRKPFRGQTLDQDLNAAEQDFLSHPRGLDVRNGGVHLSSIFKWYVEDFGGTERSLLAYLRRQAPELNRSKLVRADKVSSYQYDWSLNDVPAAIQ